MFRSLSARQTKTSVPWSPRSGLSAQHRKNPVFMVTEEEIPTELVKNRVKKQWHDAVQNKGISDPEVRKISQQLNKKIIALQKMMNEMDSLPRGSSL